MTVREFDLGKISASEYADLVEYAEPPPPPTLEQDLSRAVRKIVQDWLKNNPKPEDPWVPELWEPVLVDRDLFPGVIYRTFEDHDDYQILFDQGITKFYNLYDLKPWPKDKPLEDWMPVPQSAAKENKMLLPGETITWDKDKMTSFLDPGDMYIDHIEQYHDGSHVVHYKYLDSLNIHQLELYFFIRNIDAWSVKENINE